MKKVLVSILAFILCAVFCSCTAMNIEDTNGEDTALCSITEEDILSGKLGSTLFGSSRVTLNDNTTYSVKKMSGVLILETIKSSNKDTVFTLTLTPELISGNLRILLLGNGELVTDFPLDKATTFFLDNPECKYELVVAGESAEFSVKYTITEKDYFKEDLPEHKK